MATSVSQLGDQVLERLLSMSTNKSQKPGVLTPSLYFAVLFHNLPL